MTTLRLILGDQLNEQISSLTDCDKANDIVMLCEVWDEATYVKHHKKKIAFLFSAMRHFANELIEKGYQVHYVKLDEGCTSFKEATQQAIQQFSIEKVVVTEAAEYRVLEDQKSWQSEFNLPVDILEDHRFLATHNEFQQWAAGRKQLTMEYFYREMRKKYCILMDDKKPIGGKWNYDSENRKPPKEGLNIPAAYTAKPDKITREVIELVEEKFNHHFGDLEPFYFAVTRQQALTVLEQFINERLVNFGDYQDAMIQGEPWMYHSHISFYINCGLLLPLECIELAENAYRQGNAPINAVEGFIRQILGWREYVRGIYWLKMPNYEHSNFLSAHQKLPSFFWDAKTQMNCLHQCITETKENAYAHHIQRLMVIGNFALIAGLSPEEVNEWFLIVYADAYQWVELPNVSGMILFADGGLLASKPYAASGAYINKMSDYCKGCKYKVSKKNGKDACPFNYLYWDFMNRNENTLRSNHRLAMTYRTFDKMTQEKYEAVKHDSQQFFNALNTNSLV